MNSGICARRFPSLTNIYRIIYLSVLPSKSESVCSIQISAGFKNDFKRSTHQSTETSKHYRVPLKYLLKSVAENSKQTGKKNNYGR
jgi:hypothetical protein